MALPVTFPTFMYNDEVCSKEDMGIETSLEDSDIADTRFYRIDSVSKYIGKEKDDYTVVTFGSGTAIIPLPYKQVVKMIEA